eukprot:1137762-Pelagomonas_calceolata.AAC.1
MQSASINPTASTIRHDQVLEACTDAFPVRYCGYSLCHPLHNDEIMFKPLATECTPPFQPPNQLPPSSSCLTGEASAAAHT